MKVLAAEWSKSAWSVHCIHRKSFVGTRIRRIESICHAVTCATSSLLKPIDGKVVDQAIADLSGFCVLEKLSPAMCERPAEKE